MIFDAAMDQQTLAYPIAVLNKILNLAGLEVRARPRTDAGKARGTRQPSAGTIIEFIGTQGIGKSTLNNDLQRRLTGRWFFRADLTHIGPSASGVSDPILEKLHRDIYFSRVRHLEETQPDPWKSLTQARQMSIVIGESLTIATNEFPRGFVLDESLFKNFPREVLTLEEDGARPLWQHRAFIYLRAKDPKLVVDRYQSRAAERKSRGLPLRLPDDAEVRARVEQDNEMFDQLTKQAQAFGCPVLTIWAEDEHAHNINKILDFEQKLMD